MGSLTATSQPLHVLMAASPGTTALMAQSPTPALMAAPPPSGDPGAMAGAPRRTESAAMDQLRPLTVTSPPLPALMEANPSAPRMIVSKICYFGCDHKLKDNLV